MSIDDQFDVAEALAAISLKEAQHRARNLVSLAIALAHQSLAGLRRDPEVIAFIDRLRSLDAVARIGCEVEGDFCSLEKVAEQVTSRLDDPLSPRIVRSGPHVAIANRWAHLLALVLHELTANALRHGALSGNAGHVDVRWTVARQEGAGIRTLHLVWRETGGPSPAVRGESGAGSRLLRDLIGSSRRCRATVRMPATGLVYRLDLALMPSELND